jgi:MtN3 and saliva related transmembrane protein
MSVLCVLSRVTIAVYLAPMKAGDRRRRQARGRIMDAIEWLGMVASGMGMFAFIPQVVKTWRTRSAHDFSLTTLVMLETGVALWMIYGLLREAPAIWLGNAVTFVLAGFILLVKLHNLRFPVAAR